MELHIKDRCPIKEKSKKKVEHNEKLTIQLSHQLCLTWLDRSIVIRP
jgi:hypothetical protein